MQWCSSIQSLNMTFFWAMALPQMHMPKATRLQEASAPSGMSIWAFMTSSFAPSSTRKIHPMCSKWSQSSPMIRSRMRCICSSRSIGSSEIRRIDAIAVWMRRSLSSSRWRSPAEITSC